MALKYLEADKHLGFTKVPIGIKHLTCSAALVNPTRVPGTFENMAQGKLVTERLSTDFIELCSGICGPTEVNDKTSIKITGPGFHPMCPGYQFPAFIIRVIQEQVIV